MKRPLLVLLGLFLLASCATYQTKYKVPFEGNSVSNNQEVEHTFYLIGDAGKSPIGGMNPALQAFKQRLDNADENSTAIFLGDNIYPAGFPSKKDDPKKHKEAKSHLDAQLATLENYKGKKVFIPGNHDWYSNGPEGLKRQEKYIEDALDGKDVFLPENACPIESFDIGNDIVVITVDSHWYVSNWNKYPSINDDCEIKDRTRFFLELEDEIKDNRQKTTIIALHHPMFTYGSHGGQFGFKEHFFIGHSNIPTPILGTVANVLRRTTGASNTDLQNPKYSELVGRITTLAQFSEKVIFVSGHEHTLQYIIEENTPQIVSGSGANKGYSRLLGGSKFSTGKMGYAILKVYKDGSSAVDFIGVEDGIEELLYSTEVLPPNQKPSEYKGQNTFPPTVKASVYEPEEVDKSNFYKGVWGERYAKYYATEINAQTVDLDTLYGGLTPVRKGGGNQSRSLRLQHKDGRQFVMRALKKSAERYLQAMAFQNQFIIGRFKGTAVEDVLEYFYTGSHPYAPFTIGKLSDAVGLYHTNPRLFYIPKQKALKGFVDEFGDELYMIEEHVSEGHDIASFGYTKKIESTNNFIEKLRKDEEYKLDAPLYVRARIFDILIGDWDRHVDQWRWAQFKDEEGNKIFKPIPRDRDQPFSIMGDGKLMKFASSTIPSLRLFEGFREEIKSVKGFTSSPKTFALDMALLTETTSADWEAQAKYLQDNLTEKVIDEAFKEFPDEVNDETIAEIKRVLLARKRNLIKTAREYYGILAKYSVVTGTDKDDHFIISGSGNGDVELTAYRIKGGEKGDVFFQKTFKTSETKEIWVYGLDDDDIFEVLGNSGKIKVRLVGGQNNDVYRIAKGSGGIHTYDFKQKKNTYDEALSGNIHKLNDYDTNTYQFMKIKASNNQLIPSIGANPDDGFRIGFANTYTFNGFRQNPFTAQHTVSGAFYFATSGFYLGYSGEFANVFGSANLELNAKFTSPNFAQNFFGFGNDTPNFDDENPLELDFNRVKIRTIKFAPSLVWKGFLGSQVKLGLSYEDYEVEETEDRFIEGFYSDQNRDNQQSFVGVHGEYSYSNTDNAAYPTMGMAISLMGGYTANINESDRAFAYFIPSLSFDYRISSDGRLVLATKVKGHFNFSDDFEFYQAANIGANNGLRGFRFQRFNGKTSFYQNSDLRYSFRKTQAGFIPATPGIFVGYDYGRVWLPDDDSDTWHDSIGGGFFLNGAGLISANFGLFSSDDGLRFAFGVGFGF
ncbi:metallophosphoesterase [Croceivirga thetidis]|uniref:Phosphoesterase n=1 Tax=Croceivirga thetidis TaxID=2721623 RepID=A0ABX1GS79_9FLAO|nr:metallophosphoesterase [Croceivirga thetidis]NKI31617.1 phosphoesterase [Croceivirga thetidis]